jgi:hypothetical protein
MLYGGSVDLFKTSTFFNFEIHIDGNKSNNNTACNYILGESRMVPTSSFGLENFNKDTAFKLGIDSQEKLIV